MALNYPQGVICHKTPTNQPTKHDSMDLFLFQLK